MGFLWRFCFFRGGRGAGGIFSSRLATSSEGMGLSSKSSCFFLGTIGSHGGAEGPTRAWYRDVLRADWAKPSDVKTQFGNASILQDGPVVFNIAGNKYRLVVWINYPYRVV